MRRGVRGGVGEAVHFSMDILLLLLKLYTIKQNILVITVEHACIHLPSSSHLTS